jgi:hypothetical protein
VTGSTPPPSRAHAPARHDEEGSGLLLGHQRDFFLATCGDFLMAPDSAGAPMRRLLQSVLGLLGHTVVVPTWVIGDYVLLRGRRELRVRPDVCRCSLREAASPETLVA